jgi:hypothetical protein
LYYYLISDRQPTTTTTTIVQSFKVEMINNRVGSYVVSKRQF